MFISRYRNYQCMTNYDLISSFSRRSYYLCLELLSKPVLVSWKLNQGEFRTIKTLVALFRRNCITKTKGVDFNHNKFKTVKRLALYPELDINGLLYNGALINCFHAELFELISSWTKWPHFRRRHIQTHFLEWKCWNFDSYSTDISS